MKCYLGDYFSVIIFSMISEMTFICKLDVYPYRLNRLYPWDKRMFQHTQIINEINHRKTLKDNNHTIILSNAEKALDEI